MPSIKQKTHKGIKKRFKVTGTGKVTQVLYDRLPRGRVIAVDAAPSMVEAARAQLPADVDVREADLLDLSLEEPVDAVLSTATFHWIGDHERLFANLAMALRSGGQLEAQCGGAGNIASVIRAVRGLGIDAEVLATLRGEIEAACDVEVRTAVADLTDTEAATLAVRSLGDHFGRIDLLHFNPSAFTGKNPLELTAAELLADVALGVGALLTAVQAARRFMGPGGRVTVTGSMAADQPSPGAASLGVQKAGVRNLVQSLDATLEPDGIRAVTVTVQGSLAKTGPFTPDRVAEALIAASRQPEDDWRVEVAYDGPVPA